MRHFTLTELERMQDTQEGAMQDVCVVEVWTEGADDDYGVPAARWVDGAELACGLDMTQAKQDEAPSAETELGDGRIRLPIDTVLDRRSRIRLTERFGVLLAEPETFEIVGPARRGPSGLVVNVRKVTNP